MRKKGERPTRKIDGRTLTLVGFSKTKAKAKKRAAFLKGDRYMRILPIRIDPQGKGYGIFVGPKIKKRKRKK